jgi:EAL domain-containing protein (putative c-di-GMP-specific phosphodiesterase class I)
VSIGVVPVTSEKEDINQLLSQADVACYYAKDLGRNRVYVYHMQDSETARRHSEILQASRMRDAILHDQFLLYCQPIAHLNGNHSGIHNYEVLLRMLNDEKDLVLPGIFIPPAERYGLMPAIDRWVIRQTFSAISEHDIDKVQISINLSGNSLDDDGLLEYVLDQLQEFSIIPHQICFEITETAAIQHLGKAREFIREFRERGGKIALDDFGSGFSSFHYLKSLPVDYIKIDGAFVSNMLANPGDKAIVEAITRVAHTLGIFVIAEHATDQETVNRLREIGVEGVQGYGIGFPIPVEDAWNRK